MYVWRCIQNLYLKSVFIIVLSVNMYFSTISVGQSVRPLFANCPMDFKPRTVAMAALNDLKIQPVMPDNSINSILLFVSGLRI